MRDSPAVDEALLDQFGPVLRPDQGDQRTGIQHDAQG